MFGGRWISDGTHKAVLVAKPYGPGVWELYNLANDPGETHNLAEEKSEMLKQFIEAWDQYVKDVGLAFLPV